jgi:hypothetical protein
MIETFADHFSGDGLKILEVNDHVVSRALALGNRNVHAVGVTVQILAQTLMVGENVRGIEFYSLGNGYHMRYRLNRAIIPHCRHLRQTAPVLFPGVVESAAELR